MEQEPAHSASTDDETIALDPDLERALARSEKVGRSWLEAQAAKNKPPAGDPTGWSRPSPDLLSPVTQESISAAVVGDAASRIDAIGFEPYVRALATFLTSPKTRPPLTVSLEGDWGSGKSSFMLQLRERIRGRTGAPRSYFVDFNAWRYEKEEALWAAFALNFVRAMRRQVSPLAGLRANFTLLLQRLDHEQGLFRLLRTILATVIFIVVVVAAFLQGMNWLHLQPHEPGWWGSAVGVFGVAGVALKKAWDHTAFAFENDLTKLFDVPDYRGNRAFIETFSDDFAKIVHAYVKKGERIFVFIDDLDRCEVPRAANLLQALNLMLSIGGSDGLSTSEEKRKTDPLPIVYVLGLDRRLVCAAVAATFEKHVPYLIGGGASPLEASRAALELASDYLDKFRQVPFRMPVPTLGGHL